MSGALCEPTRDGSPADEVADLEMRVQNRLSGRVWNFRIQVQGKGLVLCGCARTYYAKQLAQHAVMAACDRPILANQIEVHWGSRATRPGELS